MRPVSRQSSADASFLLNDDVEFCLVGGADSHLGPENLLQVEAREQLHGEDNPWGFVPGEGGGFCLLRIPGGPRGRTAWRPHARVGERGRHPGEQHNPL